MLVQIGLMMVVAVGVRWDGGRSLRMPCALEYHGARRCLVLAAVLLLLQL